jgi:hypothetical protein
MPRRPSIERCVGRSLKTSASCCKGNQKGMAELVGRIEIKGSLAGNIMAFLKQLLNQRACNSPSSSS